MSIVQQGPTPNAGAAVSRGLITNLAQALAGVKTFQDGIVAASQLGANAADVCNKLGTSVADASVVQNATLLSIRSGLGGTETEYAKFMKPGASFGQVITADMKSFTNCVGLELVGANGGKNGIGFAQDGSSYIGMGNGFFDFSVTNRWYRFIANSGAFSSSPVAHFLFDLAGGAAAVPHTMVRAPSGFAQDLQRWRINATDMARIDSAGNFIVPATDGAVKLGGVGAGVAGDSIGLYVLNVGSAAGSIRPASGGGGSLGSSSGGRWGKLWVVAGDASDDFEVTTVGKGFIIKSPDGTRYRIKVANGGALSTEAA